MIPFIPKGDIQQVSPETRPLPVHLHSANPASNPGPVLRAHRSSREHPRQPRSAPASPWLAPAWAHWSCLFGLLPSGPAPPPSMSFLTWRCWPVPAGYLTEPASVGARVFSGLDPGGGPTAVTPGPAQRGRRSGRSREALAEDRPSEQEESLPCGLGWAAALSLSPSVQGGLHSIQGGPRSVQGGPHSVQGGTAFRSGGTALRSGRTALRSGRTALCSGGTVLRSGRTELHSGRTMVAAPRAPAETRRKELAVPE